MSIRNPGAGPLHSVKVVDFGRLLAGPMAAMVLSEFGATVIKVDSISRPDGWQNTRPYLDNVAGPNRSGAYTVANMNKYGITLNWKAPKGLEVARRLMAWADVAVENFRPGVMENMGLDYASVSREINPSIIMLSTSMQGQTGPQSGSRGAAPQMQGLCGLTHLTGWPDRDCIDPGIAYVDASNGFFGALALASALMHRARTGEGQHIDLAFYESCAFLLSPVLLDYTINGRVGQRSGNALMAGPAPAAAPHGIYPCKGTDRWCAISVFTEVEWHSLCRVMGHPEWTRAPELASALERCKRSDALDRHLADWTRQHTTQEVMALLQEAGVSAGAVNDLRDLNNDPQLHHRGHFKKVRHGNMGDMVVEMPSVRMSLTPPDLFKGAPCLGEDNDTVYREILGYSEEEVARMVETGVIECA